MAAIVDRPQQGAIHPFHAVMLAATVTLFLGALLGDYAYWSSHQIEWSNFASWLNAGALVVGAIALLCAFVGRWRPLSYLLVLLATWILGFINALVHARDAWAVMPTGLVLSLIVALLACVATWIGFSSLRRGGTP